MAMEVSCGQCQGRLLVETLGVVVACPHCGTHLSIPAAEPEAPPPQPQYASVPEPQLAPPPESQATPTPAFNWVPESAPAAPVVELPIPVVTDSPVSIPSMFAPPDDQNAASVFSGADENLAEPIQGWHSAPRLHLTPAEAALTEPPVLPQPAATSPPVQPPAPEATEFAFSPTQQFSLQPAPAAPPAVAPPEPAAVPAPWNFAAAPVATSPAPASSAPAAAPPAARGPVTFNPAPAPAAAAPVTFGAAAPSRAVPAPASAPAATTGPAPFTFQPAAPATPAPTASVAAPVAKESSVAANAAAFAANELDSRQRFLTILLVVIGSYASAVTIVLIYMLLFSRASALESLPDLIPAKNKSGDISWKYNPPKNDVAPGHVLSLGQSQRFGSLRVTPLKVTRGPLRFEHYSGQPGSSRDPSGPVLKLWVKFENISRDQSFVALDPHLLYTRKSINLGESIQANGFVTTETARRAGGPLHYIFDTPILSEFRIVGQNLNRTLEPGDTVEAFVPSEEEASRLSGDLVWRFQFRKGYNPKSFRGVTTLIDVRFNSNDIQDDA